MGCIGDVDCAVHQCQARTVQLPERIEEHCAAAAAVPGTVHCGAAYVRVIDGICYYHRAAQFFTSAAHINRMQLMDVVVGCADDFLGLCFHVDRLYAAVDHGRTGNADLG